MRKRRFIRINKGKNRHSQGQPQGQGQGPRKMARIRMKMRDKTRNQGQHDMGEDDEPIAVAYDPDTATIEDAVNLIEAFRANCHDRSRIVRVCPVDTMHKILQKAIDYHKEVGPVIDVKCPQNGKVTVIGDLHGQFYDLFALLKGANDFVRMPLKMAGDCDDTTPSDEDEDSDEEEEGKSKAIFPGENNTLVFLGDYVDRGNYGLEVMLSLIVLKLALPNNVVLLRGNHETLFCSKQYGFFEELKWKLNREVVPFRKKMLSLFANLPLVAIIESKVYCAHGGLFRDPDPSKAVFSISTGEDEDEGSEKDADSNSDSDYSIGSDDSFDAGMFPSTKYNLGRVDDLRRIDDLAADSMKWGKKQKSKSKRSVWRIADPMSSVLEDIVWSDPVSGDTDGKLLTNSQRGAGLVWGQDVTESFLKEHGYELIVRSHEGPDSRLEGFRRRAALDHMTNGFTVDHDVASGKLLTIFSAPDYPQYKEGSRSDNLGSVLEVEKAVSKGKEESGSDSDSDSRLVYTHVVYHKLDEYPKDVPPGPFRGAYYPYYEIETDEQRDVASKYQHEQDINAAESSRTDIPVESTMMLGGYLRGALSEAGREGPGGLGLSFMKPKEKEKEEKEEEQ